MSRRLEKVSTLLQQHAARIVAREYAMPATAITVVDVDVSPDLKNATIWMSVYGKHAEELRSRLEASAPGLIAQGILKSSALRSVPHIRLHFDYSAEHAEKISRLLSKLKDD